MHLLLMNWRKCNAQYGELVPCYYDSNIWEMLPSTGNQVRCRAHDQIEMCYPFSMGKCPCNTALKSCPIKLLKKVPRLSSA